jgi:hypothetical protein
MEVEMKRLAILIIMSVFISSLLFYSCQEKLPTEPAPKARISIYVKDESTLYFYWYGYLSQYCASFYVVVAESQGVGGRVTTCRLIFKKNNSECSSATYSGNTFPANGTCEIYCDPCVSNSCKFDTMTIIVEGTDNNGYHFSVTLSYSFTWTANNYAHMKSEKAI